MPHVANFNRDRFTNILSRFESFEELMVEVTRRLNEIPDTNEIRSLRNHQADAYIYASRSGAGWAEWQDRIIRTVYNPLYNEVTSGRSASYILFTKQALEHPYPWVAISLALQEDPSEQMVDMLILELLPSIPVKLLLEWDAIKDFSTVHPKFFFRQLTEEQMIPELFWSFLEKHDPTLKYLKDFEGGMTVVGQVLILGHKSGSAVELYSIGSIINEFRTLSDFIKRQHRKAMEALLAEARIELGVEEDFPEAWAREACEVARPY